MKTEIKSSFSTKKTLLILSFLCLLFGVACAFWGDVLLSPLVAILASVYLFDTTGRRIYSTVVSALLLIINVAAFLLDIYAGFFGLAAIALALILCIAYVKGSSKADSAYLMTIVTTVFSVFGLLLLAMVIQEEFTFDAAVKFYTDLSAEFRLIFVEKLYELYTASGIEVTQDLLGSIYDSQLKMIVSYMIIGGFVTTGLAMKIFGGIVKKYSAVEEDIVKWRFMPTKLYAYGYIAAGLLSIFLTEADVISVSAYNLYYIFLAIFAYVGFNFVLAILARRMRPVMALLLLIGVSLVFSSFALQLMAVLGVMFVLRNGYNVEAAK